MLTLTPLKCNNIQAKSDTITALIATVSDFSDVTITIKKNCCGTSYTSSSSSFSVGTFTLKIPLVIGLVLSNFILQNATTGELYTIALPTSIISSCGDTPAIFTAINNYITTNIGAGEVLTSGCSVVLGELNLDLSGTSNYIPISIEYKTSLIPITTVYFHNLPFYINDTSLIISSTIISDSTDKFDDSVYSVSIQFTSDDTTIIITQTGCIFMNCLTTCRVAKAVSLSSGRTVIDLLMYQYGLSFANDCMCDCSYLCKLFTELTSMLDKILPKTTNTTNECGCA